MGLHDRDYGRPGPYESGFKRAMRRVLGQGGSFLDWAVPLFTFRGIRVRIHIFFLIFIAVELIRSMEGGAVGVTYRAISMAVLFGIVLVHEFGHCFACRWVGGEADDVLMWPLGGLAMCHPPHTPRANLITTLGGPATHLVMGPIFAGLLLLTGAPADVLVFRPLNPFASISLLNATSNLHLYAQFALFSAYAMNAYLFLFNMLLVMFPMDAGRVLQELLWFRLGYRRSMTIAVNVGFFAAIIVGIIALSSNVPMLLTIALFCGFTCWQERNRLAVIEPDSYADAGYERAARASASKASKRGPSKADLKRRQEETALNAEVDRILEKIRTEGMGSLTKREKATLKGETERKRRQAAER